MPGFGRNGGVWQEGDVRGRNAGAWTDERDSVFGRVAGTWVQCQPEPAGELLAPTNLIVTPLEDSASIAWTNPSQAVTPTHIQYRIPEVTPVWTELPMALTTVTWPVLNPETIYQFQLRYVLRELGEITMTGPTATAFFTTLTRRTPSTPADDPANPGGASIINFPLPAGGAPGPVGSGACSWEYIIQRIDVDRTTLAVTYFDTTFTGAVAGDIGNVANLDLEAHSQLACGDMARTKYREVCNLVPGPFKFTEPYPVPCNWALVCGGVPDNVDLTRATWSNAIMATPRICLSNSGVTRVDDTRTGNSYGLMPGLLAPVVLVGQRHGLRARSTNPDTGVAILAGFCAPINALTNTTHATFTIMVNLSTQPAVDQAGGLRIATWGKQVSIRAFRSGPGYRISASLPRAGGGYITLNSAAQHNLNQWIPITVTVNQTGVKRLYCNGAQRASDDSGIAVDFDKPAFNSHVEVYGNASMYVRQIGVWNVELTPAQVGALANTEYDELIATLGATIHFVDMQLGTPLPPETYAGVIFRLNPDINWDWDGVIFGTSSYVAYNTQISNLGATVYFDEFPLI